MDLIDEDEEDPEEFLPEIKKKLKDKAQAVIGISASQAYKGSVDKNSGLLTSSNINEFREIFNHVVVKNREKYKISYFYEKFSEWNYIVEDKIPRIIKFDDSFDISFCVSQNRGSAQPL